MTSNFIWLMIAIYFEARNQPLDVQVLIGHSVMTRTLKREISVKQVCAEKGQFPWYKKLKNSKLIIDDVASLIRAADAAFKVQAERMDGIYFDADFFYSDDISPPYWAKVFEPRGKYGAFYFFKS